MNPHNLSFDTSLSALKLRQYLIGSLLHCVSIKLQFRLAKIHVALALQRHKMNVSMVHLKTEHSHAHLAAGESTLNGQSHLLGKHHHVGKFLIAQVEDVVHLMLRHHQRVALRQGVDVEKSIKLVTLGTLVRGYFARNDFENIVIRLKYYVLGWRIFGINGLTVNRLTGKFAKFFQASCHADLIIISSVSHTYLLTR